MTPNYGYITYTTQGWEPLAQILIDHLTTYSKYHTTLITINYTTTLKHPKLTTKRINTQPLNYNTITYTKYQATINTPYDLTLTINADMIPLPNIDNLLETPHPQITNNTHPTCCPHPLQPWKPPHSNIDPIPARELSQINKHLNHTQIPQKWYYATFITTPNTTPQLQKIHQTATQTHARDEVILNSYLAQHPNQQHTPYNYIPNYWIIYDLLQNNTNSPHIKAYTERQTPLHPHLLHGCKNPQEAKKISNIIKTTPIPTPHIPANPTRLQP